MSNCVWDGVFYTVMVALSQEFFQKFAELLGLSGTRIGLAVTVPVFLAAVAQQVSPWAVRRLGSYKRWVVWTAWFQAWSHVPLVGLAWWASDGAAGRVLGEWGLTWVFFVLGGAYWFGALAGGSAWMALVGMLIPKRVEARYFARRQVVLNLTLLVSLVAATEGLHWAGTMGAGWPLRVLGWMLLVAGVSRGVSAWYLGRYSEPGLAEAPVVVWPRELAGRARGSAGGRALVFLLAAQAAMAVGFPFFTAYLLKAVGVGAREFGWLLAAFFAGKMAGPEVVRWSVGRFGLRKTLAGTMVWQTGVPLVWLGVVVWEPGLTGGIELAWFVAAQVASGVGLGAFEICSVLLQLDHVPVRERASVIGQFNLGFHTAGLCGSLVGGWLVGTGGPREGGSSVQGWVWTGYASAFAVSAGARAMSLVLLRHRSSRGHARGEAGGAR